MRTCGKSDFRKKYTLFVFAVLNFSVTPSVELQPSRQLRSPALTRIPFRSLQFKRNSHDYENKSGKGDLDNFRKPVNARRYAAKRIYIYTYIYRATHFPFPYYARSYNYLCILDVPDDDNDALSVGGCDGENAGPGGVAFVP